MTGLCGNLFDILTNQGKRNIPGLKLLKVYSGFTDGVVYSAEEMTLSSRSRYTDNSIFIYRDWFIVLLN